MVSITDLSAASARTAIDVAEASEIARMARQGDPNVLSTDALQRLLGNSALVLDGLRRRPRYFDGKFLTGADLTRDQDCIPQRQADLEVLHDGDAQANHVAAALQDADLVQRGFGVVANVAQAALGVIVVPCPVRGSGDQHARQGSTQIVVLHNGSSGNSLKWGG